MTMATLLKKNIYLGLACRVRSLVYYHHGGKQGTTQADMMLKKEPIVLHLLVAGSRKGERATGPGLDI